MSLYLCCYNWPPTRLILTRLVNQMQELWCGSTHNTAVRELWDCSGRSQLRITTVTDAWFCNKRELLQPCQVHIAWIISLFHLLMLRWHTKDLVHFQLMFLLTNFLLMHPSEKHHKYFWRQTLIIWLSGNVCLAKLKCMKELADKCTEAKITLYELGDFSCSMNNGLLWEHKQILRQNVFT